MLDPHYPLYSCRSMVYLIKHFPIWLYGLNNLVIFFTLLIVQICVGLIFIRDMRLSYAFPPKNDTLSKMTTFLK